LGRRCRSPRSPPLLPPHRTCLLLRHRLRTTTCSRSCNGRCLDLSRPPPAPRRFSACSSASTARRLSPRRSVPTSSSLSSRSSRLSSSSPTGGPACSTRPASAGWRPFRSAPRTSRRSTDLSGTASPSSRRPAPTRAATSRRAPSCCASKTRRLRTTAGARWRGSSSARCSAYCAICARGRSACGRCTCLARATRRSAHSRPARRAARRRGRRPCCCTPRGFAWRTRTRLSRGGARWLASRQACRVSRWAR
ncbi:hypothetical protein EMIHUDRAFT_470780, partial [Emiliania huxleyi CCMP1516]|uniref:Uncharacterized protein n=2 Tax=Emiliania huxleyi TaxID=2903 RepID=A0A0D3IP40_EMIH1